MLSRILTRKSHQISTAAVTEEAVQEEEKRRNEGDSSGEQQAVSTLQCGSLAPGSGARVLWWCIVVALQCAAVVAVARRVAPARMLSAESSQHNVVSAPWWGRLSL